MHFTTFHRSAYYRASAPHASLHRRRDTDNDSDLSHVWTVVGPLLMTIFAICVVVLLVSFIRSRLHKRKLARKVQGQLSHLHSGSLRNKTNRASPRRTPAQSAFVGRPLPHPDEYELGIIARPEVSHARPRDGHMQTQTFFRTPARQPHGKATAPMTTNPFEDVDGPAQQAWGPVDRQY